MVIRAEIHQIYQEPADIFRALAHPTRIAILTILGEGEQCVCHLEAMLGLRQSYISQHLMVLRQAGLVFDRRDGWNIFYRRTRRNSAKLSDALKIITGARAPVAPRAPVGDVCPCPKCSRKRTKRTASTRRRMRSEYA